MILFQRDPRTLVYLHKRLKKKKKRNKYPVTIPLKIECRCYSYLCCPKWIACAPLEGPLWKHWLIDPLIWLKEHKYSRSTLGWKGTGVLYVIFSHSLWKVKEEMWKYFISWEVPCSTPFCQHIIHKTFNFVLFTSMPLQQPSTKPAWDPLLFTCLAHNMDPRVGLKHGS